jgi:hypothetical protein
LFAIAVSDLHIAVGGIDGKISFWNIQTGAFRNYVQILSKKELEHKELYIQNMTFIGNRYLLVVMNSGEIHIAHHNQNNLCQRNVASTVVN